MTDSYRRRQRAVYTHGDITWESLVEENTTDTTGMERADCASAMRAFPPSTDVCND